MLESKFPRSYLQALYNRLQELERLGEEADADATAGIPAASPRTVRQRRPQTRASQARPRRRAASSHGRRPAAPRRASSGSSGSSNSTAASASTISAQRATAANTWGSTSAIAFFDHVCQATGATGAGTALDEDEALPVHASATADWMAALSTRATRFTTAHGITLSTAAYPPPPATHELLRQYLLSVETFVPIVGRSTAEADLQVLHRLLDGAGGGSVTPPSPLTICTVVRAQLVLASALRVMMGTGTGSAAGADDNEAYARAADTIFDDALANLRPALIAVTAAAGAPSSTSTPWSDSSDRGRRAVLDRLQLILLLAVFLVLAPRRGNIWQVLGFADRMCRMVPRGVKAAQDAQDAPQGISDLFAASAASSSSSSPSSTLAARLCTSYVVLELFVGTALGRPSALLDYGGWLGLGCGGGGGAGGAGGEQEPDAASQLPVALVQLVSLRVRIHAAFQAVMRSASSAIDYDDVERQLVDWWAAFEAAVGSAAQHAASAASSSTGPSASPSGPSPATIRRWLLATGRALADGTRLLLLSLQWQHGPGRSALIDDPHAAARARRLVRALLGHYAAVARMRRAPQAQGSGASPALPVLPFSWIWAMDVFRTAAMALLLDGSDSPGGSDGSPGPEVTAAAQLLDDYGSFDGRGLAWAVLTARERTQPTTDGVNWSH